LIKKYKPDEKECIGFSECTPFFIGRYPVLTDAKEKIYVNIFFHKGLNIWLERRLFCFQNDRKGKKHFLN
jgi:hypothetical protein